MDLESVYWDQYCAEGLGEGVLPLPQPPADAGSASSRDSYWSRYSCARSSAWSESTPDLPQQQLPQRRRWRLLVVPEKLATLRLDDACSGGAAQTVASGAGTAASESALGAAGAAGGASAEHNGACDPPQIRRRIESPCSCDSSGGDEAIVPPGSPSGPASWGINPAALEMRLQFLKQEIDQRDRLQQDAATPLCR
ncbi:hypothetical protein IWQ56_005923 [Coemansia nantahalensis]|nr:hypothetical protein IWQ56_005923 [Coemansia nantahalensis]